MPTSEGEKTRCGELRARLQSCLVNDLWGPALVAMMLGLLPRLYFVFRSPFPINDGGMFVVMARDLQESSYQLPDVSSYNGINAPFAYPPLWFYVVALLNGVTGIGMLDLLQFLPLAGSSLSVVAFFLVARSLLPSPRAVEASVLIFALTPRAFDWEIAGGGLTRSFGFLFAILAIHQSIRLTVERRHGVWPVVGLFAALAVLSHPEMGIFFAVSYGLLLVRARPLDRRLCGASAGAAILAVVLTAPWWAGVLVRHGPDPLLDGGAAGFSTFLFALRILDPAVFNEPLLPVVLFLTVVGVAITLRRGEWLLSIWVLLIFLVDPRKAPTEATVPAAMLAGIAASEVVLRPLKAAPDRVSSRASYYGLASILLVSAQLSPLARLSPLVSLSSSTADVFTWVQASTSEDSRFLVVSNRDWARDGLSEWFPALTGRVSVATPQAYEWLGAGPFAKQMERHAELQLCALSDAQCLDEWEAANGDFYTHVLVATEDAFTGPKRSAPVCCEGLRRSLLADPRFILLYDGPAGAVFQRTR